LDIQLNVAKEILDKHSKCGKFNYPESTIWGWIKRLKKIRQVCKKEGLRDGDADSIFMGKRSKKGHIF